jgi:hypothetical protein
MTKVYILTAGVYSDYHIVATFSTRELAEEAKKFCGDDDPEIQEYELDSLQIPDHPPGHTAWFVNIDISGARPLWIRRANILECNFTPSETLRPQFGNYSNYSVGCWARDEEHAKKIALDKYYQWKYEVSQLDT